MIYLLSISWSFYLFISCIIISGWVYCLLHFLGWRSEMNSRAPLPTPPCFISSPLLLARPPETLLSTYTARCLRWHPTSLVRPYLPRCLTATWIAVVRMYSYRKQDWSFIFLHKPWDVILPPYIPFHSLALWVSNHSSHFMFVFCAPYGFVFVVFFILFLQWLSFLLMLDFEAGGCNCVARLYIYSDVI